MTPIDALYKYIRHTYPNASVDLTAPLHEGGVWSLDVDLDTKSLAIEWSSKTGFGISSVSRENFGEAPDEVFGVLEEAQTRIDQLLTSNEQTVPPFPVMLSRLRERRGFTQQQLAAELGVSQATVSGVEHRKDIQLSTLQRLTKALGGVVEVFACFPEGRYRIEIQPPEPQRLQTRIPPGERAQRAKVVIASTTGPTIYRRLAEAGSLQKAYEIGANIQRRQSLFELT